jgi:RNA polymerase sigma-70 factor (ECF subfamily)
MGGPHQPGALAPEVVDAARGGDAAAITEVYRCLAPAVMGYLRGAGVRDPDNVAGDVFEGMVRSLPNFAGDGPALRTWVFTIAHRRLVDERRRMRRRPECGGIDDNVVRFVARDEFEPVLDAISAAPARRALARLTPDQRSVVVLRVVAQLSLAETAKVVGKPVPAVKMLQRRALDALARELPEALVT